VFIDEKAIISQKYRIIKNINGRIKLLDGEIPLPDKEPERIRLLSKVMSPRRRF